MLNYKLQQYLNNVDDPMVNFALGQEYEAMGQTGAAISFYLRTAERSTTDLEQYESLLRCALCFEKQRTRDDSEKTLLLKAIALMPTRPEAYYLLARLYEIQSNWQDCYTLVCLGLQVCNLDPLPLATDVQYPGYFALMFMKGASAWWVGHCEESREIMIELKFNYKLTPAFSNVVDRNISSIGWPSTTCPYLPELKNRIRFKFDGLDSIEKNYAQSYQDLFVLSATNGRRNGKYLEIGSAEPFKNNNTALLETAFDWSGVSIDINKAVVEQFANERNNLVFCLDALTTDYEELLSNLGFSGDMDYLQIDCDPPAHSLAILKRIPFDQYRFAAITFEHDYYADPTVRDQSREYLRSKGYELIVGDIAHNKIHSYEDWWVHPELVDSIIRDKLRDTTNSVKYTKEYMFPEVKQISAPAIVHSGTHCELVNSNYDNGAWIVDNFYQDPDSVRDFALQQEFEIGGLGHYYIGNRTFKQFLFPGLKEEFERIMNRPITKWEEHGMNGRFQYCTEGQPLVYHCDDQSWAGMLYLTPDAPYQCGTSTWAKRGTDIRDNKHPRIMECFRPGSQNLDRTIFDPVDVFGNVYNRLVIFKAGYLHSASEYFGYTKENSRLWQMFFFD